MDELQEMREQMAALKEKLNKQEIVNENNLCTLLKEKVKNWQILMILSMVLSPLLIVAMFFMEEHGTFIAPIGYAVLLLWSTIVAFRSIRSIKKKNLIAGRLKDVLPTLYRLREREKGPAWLIGMGCLIGVNALDAIATMYKRGGEFGPKALSFLAVFLGSFLFAWLLWKFILQRQPSQWDEYIRQIEEMTEDDEEEQVEEKQQ